MACKRRTNGGTQWNTCRRTTLGAKLVGKMHPMVSKRFQNGSFWAKMPILTKMPLLAIGDPKWRTQVEQMMVLNGIHAGEHKQKSAIGNCWGIQCINTLCLFLTSIISHFSDAYIPFNAPVHAWRKNGKYDVCLVTGVHAFCVLHSFVYHHLFNFQGARPKKHPHRRNVTRHHFFDYYKFHQYTTFINRQLSSIDNFHQRTNLVCVNKQLSSSLTRATSVKALEAIFKSSVKSPKVILTDQSHISQISRRHQHTPGSHQSNQC